MYKVLSAPDDYIRDLLSKYGSNSMSYSNLQPDLNYYIDYEYGCLAYIPLRHILFAPFGLNVVIGDPLSNSENYSSLLDSYMKNNGVATIFLHIESEFADVLSGRGYLVNELGVEWEIPLGSFDFSLTGKKYTHLRRWRNKAIKEGVEVFEENITQVNRDEIDSISKEWLSRKGGVELVGLNRPLSYEVEKDVRCFFAKYNGRLVSMAVFDPMYTNHRVIGYLHNLSRTHIDAPHGTNDLIILDAMRAFYEDDIDFLSLGLSPLSDLTEERYKAKYYLTCLFRFMYSYCSFVYPFQGNFFHKEKYRGDRKKLYISAVPEISIYKLIGFFKALNIL